MSHILSYTSCAFIWEYMWQKHESHILSDYMRVYVTYMRVYVTKAQVKHKYMRVYMRVYILFCHRHIWEYMWQKRKSSHIYSHMYSSYILVLTAKNLVIRIDKIICLVCKGSLYKRPYSAESCHIYSRLDCQNKRLACCDYVPWLLHICAMTHSQMCHDSQTRQARGLSLYLAVILLSFLWSV